MRISLENVANIIDFSSSFFYAYFGRIYIIFWPLLNAIEPKLVWHSAIASLARAQDFKKLKLTLISASVLCAHKSVQVWMSNGYERV
jgi:hypothetical protein